MPAARTGPPRPGSVKIEAELWTRVDDDVVDLRDCDKHSQSLLSSRGLSESRGDLIDERGQRQKQIQQPNDTRAHHGFAPDCDVLFAEMPMFPPRRFRCASRPAGVGLG